MHTGESAINRGLAKRLKDLEKERERRNRAAREDDLQFSLDFLSTSRKVFRMIDKDDSGTLEKDEIVRASALLNRGLRALDSLICLRTGACRAGRPGSD